MPDMPPLSSADPWQPCGLGSQPAAAPIRFTIPHEWSSPEARAPARRHETTVAQMAAQRAIYRKQQQVETRLVEERKVAIALRDRGTVDGLA